MKKVFGLLLLSITLICGSVFADMAPPALEYEATVSNPEGAIIYGRDPYGDYDTLYPNGKLSYGATIGVSYIEEHNNEQYTDVRNVQTEDGKTWGLVLLKDLTKKTPWKMSDFTFKNLEGEDVVLAREGVEIYEWPSKSEKVLGKIPYGTLVKYKIANEDGFWGYVTYNGVNGWIHIINNSIGNLIKDGKLMTTWRGASILDINGKEIGKIPPNTLIEKTYRTNTGKDLFGTYYVIYNGVSGYIHFNDDFSDEVAIYWYDGPNGKFTINYDGAILIGTDNEIISIPEGTTLEYTFGDNGYQKFTNYNGKDGWVFERPGFPTGDEEAADRSLNRVREAIKEAIAFIQGEQKTSGEEMKVENDDIEQIINNESGENVINSDVQDNTSKNDIALSSIQVILICISCAVIASLVTAVIVVLINQKNK